MWLWGRMERISWMDVLMKVNEHRQNIECFMAMETMSGLETWWPTAEIIEVEWRGRRRLQTLYVIWQNNFWRKEGMEFRWMLIQSRQLTTTTTTTVDRDGRFHRKMYLMTPWLTSHISKPFVPHLWRRHTTMNHNPNYAVSRSGECEFRYISVAHFRRDIIWWWFQRLTLLTWPKLRSIFLIHQCDDESSRISSLHTAPSHNHAS